MVSIQSRYTRRWFSGTIRTRPSRTASIAGAASASMRMNHCSEISGSMRSPGAVRVGDVVLVGLLGDEAALGPQRGHHRRARVHHGEPREALPRLGGHAPVLADHRDLVEFVALADLEVVGVVRGGDLQLAGAEVPLDVLVGDDRQVAPHQRQHRRAPDQLAVALVVGVDRHRGVSQHRLGAHRCDRHASPRRPGRSGSSTACRSRARSSTSRSEIAEREPGSQLTM